MTKTMLIDAAHEEETRVVVLDEGVVAEFDFVTSRKQQLKGNIYLAKVTRIEPSLQAAFVEYGGDRQGFLAFSEIHPNYYQIPAEDRQALLEELGAVTDEEEEAEENEAESAAGRQEAGEDGAEQSEEEASGSRKAKRKKEDISDESARSVETLDEVEYQSHAQKFVTRRGYKIQEVVKRGQVLLVQVIKEERGNKGAALTTHISIAGRYCVLMPNLPGQGGVSRKIKDFTERRRLRKIVQSLRTGGMSMILRTAAIGRTKIEIKRDFDYLVRLWEGIREDTLNAKAPAAIYEESNIVKRSLRDLYDSQTEEVLVEGESIYKEAKAFMKTMMPSHASRVKHYKDVVPLFSEKKVESQLASLLEAHVPLSSGGSIVMSSTEALVAIDVNSGRATKERGIEETALNTNIEAAHEIARQLRLRDLAGLIVIDFIDMEETRNRKRIERIMREALQPDRARIQIGRISHFGLMEMTRQRLRPSLLETAAHTCPACLGRGVAFSEGSQALQILRQLEAAASTKRYATLTVSVSPEVAHFLLNDKRAALTDVEQRYDIVVIIESERGLPYPGFQIEGTTKDGKTEIPEIISYLPSQEGSEGRGGRKRRRRGGKRRKDRKEEEENAASEEEKSDASDGDTDNASGTSGKDTQDESADDAKEKKPRSRRGGRRRAGARGDTGNASPQEKDTEDTPENADIPPAAEAETDEKPPAKRRTSRRRSSKRTATEESGETGAAMAASKETSAKDEEPAKKPTRRRAPRGGKKATGKTVIVDESPAASDDKDGGKKEDGASGAPRKGWWQRTGS